MAGSNFAAQAGAAHEKTPTTASFERAGSAGANRFFVFRSLRVAHAQAHAGCGSSGRARTRGEVVEVATAHASTAAAPAAAADPLAGLSPEDADVHRKAQRFARLLVDEIKLYNQAKVAEGRRNKDLYDRLKEDIDKSRGTFQKRYGNTAAASGDYFQHRVAAQPGRR